MTNRKGAIKPPHLGLPRNRSRPPSKPPPPTAEPAIITAEVMPAVGVGNNASLALIRLYTNGIADDRIEKATQVLADDQLTVNEKLTRIDTLIAFPTTASAKQLGDMLGTSKQAVLKTEWWVRNRKGEKESEVGRRQRRASDADQKLRCTGPGR